MTRVSHSRAILGSELSEELPQTKVLLVGAGGIGCELLKNLVLTGIGHITLLDLDTIDLSNLNRQFLFRKKDVKQSKALVAAAAASSFNPSVRIYPIHGNIKEERFDVQWFREFDLVLNALDNLDARRHVNKMCMAANVPLVESGTAGYLGQVQPIRKDRTECFSCSPKETPKTFPVCTIRSTPSQPIHCIVWAKSYLFGQLFGEDEDAASQTELDAAQAQGENAKEIEALRREAMAFGAVRKALRVEGATSGEEAAKLAFSKVFHSDILNLLSMADMWRSRAPPTPLDFDAIRSGNFALPNKQRSAPNGTGANGKAVCGEASTSTAGSKLKDQQALSLEENLQLFVSSTGRLSARLRGGEETISFDKDDDDTLDFVTAAANLRSAAYGIAGKTRWEIKEMAGNIIPAIATTNAIVAGLIVLQALHMLRKSYDRMRSVHIQIKGNVPLSASKMCGPSDGCGVCRDTYAVLLCDPARTTLGEVLSGVLGSGDDGEAEGEWQGTGEREVSVYEDKRILSDPDWDDNLERTLESLNVSRGNFLTIVDEDDEWGSISLSIGVLPMEHPVDGPAYILPSPLPKPVRKPKVARRPETITPPLVVANSLKRSAPDDDVIEEVGPASKKARTTNGGAFPSPLKSPSKKRRLEEEGLIMMDSAQDKLEDDVIELD